MAYVGARNVGRIPAKICVPTHSPVQLQTLLALRGTVVATYLLDFHGIKVVSSDETHRKESGSGYGNER
jgi:hypothetical protein